MTVNGFPFNFRLRQQLWITPEAPLPEAMTQNDDCITTWNTVLFPVKGRPRPVLPPSIAK